MVHTWVYKKIFRSNLMRFVQQFILQLQRQFKIKIFEKSALVIIFLVPLVLGVITGLVFLGNNENYNFRQNDSYASFLFMMIITSLFLGLLISIIEIMKERQVINKEKLFGISIYSYYFSKLLILSIAGLIQIVILYSVGTFILEIPLELFTINMTILYIVIFNSIAIGLLVSSLVKSFVFAYNMVSILVLPQILLGGGFILYESMSSKISSEQEIVQMPYVAMVFPASWAYEDIIVSNYTNIDGFNRNSAIEASKIDQKSLDAYMSSTKTLSLFGILKIEMLTSFFNKFFLLSQALIALVATLLALKRRDTQF